MTKEPRGSYTPRVGLLAVGLLLTVAALALLVLGFGGFGSATSHVKTLPPQAVTFPHRHWWFWPAVAVGGALLTLVSLRWLLSQFRVTRVRLLDLEADRQSGETVLTSSAVAEAVTSDIDAYRGVKRSVARLDGSSTEPVLSVAVLVDERADMAALRNRIESDALARVRACLDRDDLPVNLRLRVAQGGRRVN